MKLLITLDEEYINAINKIKFLVGGRTDRKLQLEIIKAIKNGKPIEQEPIDYKTQYENYLKKSEVVISQLRADRDRLQDAFDQIRVEIEEHVKINQCLNTDRAIALCWCLDVIDKYKGESEK